MPSTEQVLVTRTDPQRDAAGRSVLVLQEDPDLVEGLPAEECERATRLLRAVVLELPTGVWVPPAPEPDAFGMLVLEGLLLRLVTLGKAVSLEPIGAGNVIRPGELSGQLALLPYSVSWEAIEPVRLAVLGREATTVIGHWPELAVAFSSRIMARVRSQALFMAAANFTRVEGRLLAAFWHLAGLWGKVAPEGILVPFTLTHETLAQLVGARRPSVTLAMGALKREQRIIRRPDGYYVLLGDPPDWQDATIAELDDA